MRFPHARTSSATTCRRKTHVTHRDPRDERHRGSRSTLAAYLRQDASEYLTARRQSAEVPQAGRATAVHSRNTAGRRGANRSCTVFSMDKPTTPFGVTPVPLHSKQRSELGAHRKLVVEVLNVVNMFEK